MDEINKKLKQLDNDDVIVNEKGDIVKMPSRNKACPCNSKTNYKNCCLGKDRLRKEEYIKRITKSGSLESEPVKVKQQTIINL